MCYLLLTIWHDVHVVFRSICPVAMDFFMSSTCPDILREVARCLSSLIRLGAAAKGDPSVRQALVTPALTTPHLLAQQCLFILQNSLDSELLAQVSRLIYVLCYYESQSCLNAFVTHAGMEGVITGCVIERWDELSQANVGGETALSYCLRLLEVSGA